MTTGPAEPAEYRGAMKTDKTRPAWDLHTAGTMSQAIRHARLPLCITDPNIPDNPIVYANLAFAELTGYEPEEVTGRNCRFLQGKDTTPASVAAVREVIESQRVDTVEILNYRKDGSTFLNALQLGPIMDDSGEPVFFFGSQLDISAKRDVELQARELADSELLHRLRNVVNVMAALIRMAAREENDATTLSETLIGRLEALSKAHFDTIHRPRDAPPDFGKLAETLLVAYAPFGREQIVFSGSNLALPPHLISPITLLLHELATNAVKHGALGSVEGKITLDWTADQSEHQETIRLRWVEENGPEVVAPSRQSGSSIIRKLVAASGGDIDFDWRPGGLVATVTFAG